jgi:hypothetical protein
MNWPQKATKAESEYFNMKPILIILSVLVLLAYISCHEHSPPSHIVSQDIKKLMKYHGIQVLYEDYQGRLWFKRNGQKIYIDAKVKG